MGRPPSLSAVRMQRIHIPLTSRVLARSRMARRAIPSARTDSFFDFVSAHPKAMNGVSTQMTKIAIRTAELLRRPT